MSSVSGAQAAAKRQHLGTVSTLARLALIGVALGAVIGAFAYFGGWFSPYELTQARFVNGFQKVFGFHSGFRRNHAKGVCVTGFFDSNGQGTRLSKAVVFQTGRVPVIGRFSLGGGNPYVADTPDTIRGLGLQFRLRDGEEWRTAMINRPVFPVNTAQAFYDNLIASQPDPNTHKPDPEKMAAFLASHPETVQAISIHQKPRSLVWFRQQHFQRSQCVPFHRRGGHIDPRTLDAGAGTAVCTCECDRGDRRKQLSF